MFKLQSDSIYTSVPTPGSSNQTQFSGPPPLLKPRLPDTSIPPPALPAEYGSLKYPGVSDKLAPWIPAEEQMLRISMCWKEMEREEERESRMIGRELFRIRNQDLGAKYCKICSEYKNGSLTFHTHTSSRQYRMSAPMDKCITCKQTLHSFKTGSRYAIMLTSSILNQWQGKRYVNQYPGDDIHVDTIGIPGGTVEELSLTLCAEYGETKYPVDVLLI